MKTIVIITAFTLALLASPAAQAEEQNVHLYGIVEEGLYRGEWGGGIGVARQPNNVLYGVEVQQDNAGHYVNGTLGYAVARGKDDRITPIVTFGHAVSDKFYGGSEDHQGVSGLTYGIGVMYSKRRPNAKFGLSFGVRHQWMHRPRGNAQGYSFTAGFLF